eukprot:PhF_6_TR4490/c0_g1_i1/m.6186/K19612/PDE12; 2',5'-phosphodiesterase
MYKPVFVHVLASQPILDIEIPLDTTVPGSEEPEYRRFSRPRDDSVFKTLERMRFAFAPPKPPPSPPPPPPASPDVPPSSDEPKAKKKSPTPKKSAATGKNEKEEKLKTCPAASIWDSTETKELTADPAVAGLLTNEDAFAAGNVLVVGTMRWRVTINVPRVKRFTAPVLMAVGCPSVPVLAESYNINDPSTQVKWRWLEEESHRVLSTSLVYTPTIDVVGKHIVVECIDGYNHHTRQTTTETVKARTFGTRLPNPLESTDSQPNATRVVTYNILHDAYADSEYARAVLYPYVRPDLLTLKGRELRVGEELLSYNADIICLQEVGWSTFESYLKPMLQNFGFDGCYESKYRSAMCGTATKDGSCILWSKSKFQYVSHTVLPLTYAFFETQYGKTPYWKEMETKLVTGYAQVTTTLRNVTTIGVIAKLRHVATNKAVYVLNAHLFYHPHGRHIRFLQTQMMMDTLGQLVAAEPETTSPAVLFCGDLNSFPKSIVHEYLHSGCTNEDHVDWHDSEKFRWDKEESSSESQNPEEQQQESQQQQSSTSLSQQLPLFALNAAIPKSMMSGTEGGQLLRDVCSHWGPDDYTNFTPLFKARLDYIFYTPKTFDVVSVLPNPTVEELTENIAIPSERFPSDHVAIVADFKLLCT